jgi:hypothetical protein
VARAAAAHTRSASIPGLPDPTGRSPRDFAVFVAIVNGRTVARVVGELDIATTPAFDEALHAVPGPLTIDARHLAFIDARGLGSLVRADRRTGVSVRHANAFCRRVLELGGLESLLAD